MKSVSIVASILVIAASCLGSATAFVPNAQVSTTAFTRTTTSRNMGFMPEPEREQLTRESEPEEFFAT
jgi:hypothetical protein